MTIAVDLTDDLHLLVTPTGLGSGMPVVPRDGYTALRVVGVHPFDFSVIAMHHALK